MLGVWNLTSLNRKIEKGIQYDPNFVYNDRKGINITGYKNRRGDRKIQILPDVGIEKR